VSSGIESQCKKKRANLVEISLCTYLTNSNKNRAENVEKWQNQKQKKSLAQFHICTELFYCSIPEPSNSLV